MWYVARREIWGTMRSEERKVERWFASRAAREFKESIIMRYSSSCQYWSAEMGNGVENKRTLRLS